MAPTATATKPIIYSVMFPFTLGDRRTTIHAEIKNAIVPSRLLDKNLCLPNFLPSKAALESLMIKTLKAVMTNILGRINTQSNADINT